MKSIPIVILILFPFIANTQEPQRDDNTILLITDSKPENNFTLFGRYLIEKGYSFDISDKEFMMLKTTPKVSLNNRGKQSSLHHRFTVTFNDSLIKIKPEFEIPNMAMDMTWIEWHHRTSKSDFNYMNWANNFKSLFEKYEDKNEMIYTQE